MTSQQKIIILLWLSTLDSLIVLTIFDEWILDNWGGIKWPFLCVILFFSALSQSNPSSSIEQGRHNINEIVSSNPWIKVYMAAYCFIVVIMSLRAMNSGINPFENMGNTELIMSLFGIMLPVFVIQQIQLYKNAGK